MKRHELRREGTDPRATDWKGNGAEEKLAVKLRRGEALCYNDLRRKRNYTIRIDEDLYSADRS